MAQSGDVERLKRAAFGRDATAEDVRAWQDAVATAVPEPVVTAQPGPAPTSWSLGSPTETDDVDAMLQDERTYVAPELDDAERQVRRRRGRKRLVIAASITAALVVASVGYVNWALNAPIGTAAAVSEAPTVPPGEKAEILMSPEGSSAISIVGGDDYLGPTANGIYAKSGSGKPRPIASISKLITAMVILSKYPLKEAGSSGPSITFSKADHALYDMYYVQGATVAEMPTGVTHTLHESLEAMLVASACNYADAVSTWAFGSRSAFLAATQSWLKKNGMDHTTIVEPTGLDARNTSTPSDMITLGKLAMKNPAIRAIVGMPVLDVEGIPSVANTNSLVGSNGITGLKTGTLQPSGSDLLFSADLNAASTVITVTGVVLGGYSHDSVNLDVLDIINSISEGFHPVQVATKGHVVGTYTTPWGEAAQMVLASDASMTTWSDTPITATIETTTLTTGDKGENVGTVTFTAGPDSIEVPVELDDDISPPDEWWRLTHPFEIGQSASR